MGGAFRIVWAPSDYGLFENLIQLGVLIKKSDGEEVDNGIDVAPSLVAQ